jgi:pimeloyl-ACP methyl ester carboxylesterase
MFRDLIPELSDRYHVIAPDLPGFGQTKAPPRAAFDYSFDNLADVIAGFVEAIGLARYALYIFDYGAPTGLRLAMRHPQRVSAIITQNGNAYIEGLSQEWGPWQTYWREPTPEHREATRPSLSDEAIRFQYLHGAPAGLVSPDGYTLDMFYMHRPEAEEIQLDLILSYRTNVALLSRFPGLFPRAPAALAGGVGQERSVFHSARGGSLPARPSRRRNPLPRDRTLRARNAPSGNRPHDARFPGTRDTVVRSANAAAPALALTPSPIPLTWP